MFGARSIMFAAAISAGVTMGFAAPAAAAFVPIGSVDVGFRVDRDTAWNRFGGRMEGLRLVADHSDIFCRSIIVTYGNGGRDRLFSGPLREDRPVYVDLKGGSRWVKRIDFVCRSDSFSGGKVRIVADVGRYMDEWRRAPDWSAYWAPILGGGGPVAVYGGFDWGGHNPNNWVSLGRQTFEGRFDRESSFAGWGGTNVNRVALRPLDSSATCRRVWVRFGNRELADLPTPPVMRRGGFYVLDIPGNRRNIGNMTLNCHSVDDNRVTIEIYAHK